MTGADTPYFNPSIETATADEIAHLQLQQLPTQLRFLNDKSPFYAEKLKQVGASPLDIMSYDALAKLPFTEKHELRESQVQHPPLGNHAGAAMEDVVRIHASSGTTGTPSFVGITEHDKQRWTECICRSFWSQGLRPRDIFAMGMSIGFFVGGIPTSNAVEHIGATLLPIGTGASDRLISSIQKTQATVLATTPSYAIYLAEIAERDMGIDVSELSIERAFVGAEPGGGEPEVRAQIERLWNAKCTEAIGNADVITMHSAECDAQDGCHYLAPDYMILELIDPETGMVLPMDGPEVQGEMVLTHLDRQCNPMLRFRTRDIVTLKTSPYSCGRTGPRLKCIGRSDDMLIVRGVNVWPSAIRDVVMTFMPEVSGQILVSLDEPGPKIKPPLPVKVELNSGTTDSKDLTKRIEQELRAKLIFSATVELVPPGSLQRTEMKATLVERPSI